MKKRHNHNRIVKYIKEDIEVSVMQIGSLHSAFELKTPDFLDLHTIAKPD